MAEKIIIDTDPAMGIAGRDIDDGLAIALALKSPETDVLALTITHGNVGLEQADRCALELLRASGRRDVRVYTGALSEKDTGRQTAATEYIASALDSSPGEITLIAIGPLSNLAAAEKLHPGTLAKARKIVCMGGALRCRGWAPPAFRAEFNIWKDAVSAAEFFAAAQKPTIVPLDLTSKVVVELKHILKMRESKDPFSRYLFDKTISWYTLSAMPAYAVAGKAGFMPHDPLAVGAVIWPELFRFVDESIEVRTGGIDKGRTVISNNGFPVNVAFKVDSAKFLEKMFNVIAGRG